MVWLAISPRQLVMLGKRCSQGTALSAYWSVKQCTVQLCSSKASSSCSWICHWHCPWHSKRVKDIWASVHIQARQLEKEPALCSKRLCTWILGTRGWHNLLIQVQHVLGVLGLARDQFAWSIVEDTREDLASIRIDLGSTVDVLEGQVQSKFYWSKRFILIK